MTLSGRGSAKAPGATWFRWLWLLVSAPVVALSVFRAVPAQWPVLVVQLVSFTPWLAVPATAALLLAFLGRSRLQQGVAVVLLVCQAFWLFPLDTGRPAPAAIGTKLPLAVMSLNAELGQADAGHIVALVRDNNVSLLALQEFTQGLQDRLSAAGLDQLLPQRVSQPSSGATGSALYSRHPMEAVGSVPDTPFRIPTVRLTAEANGTVAVLEVTSVHVFPPVEDHLDQWRSDLAAVGRVADRPGARLLAGDFNATYDHAEFRALLARGQGRDGEAAALVDVGAASGSRLVPTWPMDGQLLPGVTIDHLVISRDLDSSGYRVQRVAGTDHAAVMATLSLPAAG
ncbi:endonuclease/exonuclease/phosphatase family protein [Arthrobacter sp. HMWF013]|uniref:endonuclease/exonuclease/phosphatase family protein n=1 Tax=Arthrobacter sp. HMWF013 TaxID=2056849 RepID=UPI000D39C2B8|nr:endonuclease/exonuclease/phosphatase family protein [Arthrobacter sp. HMWF013]PTT62200.1 endonuclease [Arthrobacter sp. HMWF013]